MYRIMRSCLLLLVLMTSSAFGQKSLEWEKQARQEIARGLEIHRERAAKWKAAKKLMLVPGKVDDANIPNNFDYYEGRTVIPDRDQTSVVSWCETRVVSIVDENNCLIMVQDDIVWLEDFPTNELSDDLNVRIVQPIKNTGQRKYTAVNGASRTVRTIRMLTPKEQKVFEEEYRNKIKEEAEAAADTFSLKNGRIIRGQLLSSEKGIVTFFDTDRKNQSLKLAEITPESVTKIRKILKQGEEKNIKK